MAADVKQRKRAARRSLWLSAIVFGALVAAVIAWQLPDWAAPLVFVAGFLLGGYVVARVFAVFVTATAQVAARRRGPAVGPPAGHPLPNLTSSSRNRRGVGFGHNAAAHAAPPAPDTTDGSEISR